MPCSLNTAVVLNITYLNLNWWNHTTHKHKRCGDVVSFHAMELIQPHLLRLDLTVEWWKLLCHAEWIASLKLLTWLIHPEIIRILRHTLIQMTEGGCTYRNTTNSAIRMEISDRKPRSSLLFILSLSLDFSQQQTSPLHSGYLSCTWNMEHTHVSLFCRMNFIFICVSHDNHS